MTAEEILELQRAVSEVTVDDAIVDYLMRIVAATRNSEMLDLGVSPRGTLALFRAAQALALTEERDYCIPDDVKRLVIPVFAHRITVSSRYASAMRRSEEAEAVLHEILKDCQCAAVSKDEGGRMKDERSTKKSFLAL